MAVNLNNKSKKAIGLALSALLAFGGYSYYNHTEKAAAEESMKTLKIFGNVDVRESTLAFRQSDRIAELMVEEGDQVTEGQTLGQLDNRDLLTQMEKTRSQIAVQESVLQRLLNGNRHQEVSQAAARLEAAKAEAENARQNLQKTQSAYDTSGGKSVSRDELDSARSLYEAKTARVSEAQAGYSLMAAGSRAEDIEEARAQLKALQDELKHQEYLLGEYTLKAPADGVVRSRLMEPGDMASPQQPVFKISLNSKKWVRAYVNEVDLGRIYEGQEAQVIIDSRPDMPLAGQIGYISSTAEFSPKTVQTEELRTALLYEVRIYVDDTNNVLRMGMPATVTIDM